MGFIKQSLLALLVVSVFSLAFVGLTGDLNTYYGGIPNTQNNTYLNQVQNISNRLQVGMKPSDISSTSGETGLVGSLLTGGKLVANTFSIILTTLPTLFTTLVVNTTTAMGLPPWVGGVTLAAIGILITTALIWFVLRRKM